MRSAFSPFDPLSGLGQAIGGLGNGGHRQTSAQIHGSAAQDPGNAGQGGADPSAADFQAVAQALNAAVAQANYPGGLIRVSGDPSVTINNCNFGYAEPPPPHIEDAGIRVGEVIAWRCWRVEQDWLYSVIEKDFEWEPGKPVEAHKINEIWGIHAFKTRKRAIAEYGHYVTSGMVVGRVALWGQIYEFEKGWHGEFARVHSLDWTNVEPKPPIERRRRSFFRSRAETETEPDLLDRLRKIYGVEQSDTTAS